MKSTAHLIFVFSFLATSSCVTPGGRESQTQTGQMVWTNPDFGARGLRAPAEARDFLREIEQATGSRVEKWLADESLVDAGTRMKKVFEIARSTPEPFFAQLRRERPILGLKGASGMVVLKGEKKIPNIYVVTRYRDVQEVLDHNAIFSVRPYSGIMDATVGSPYMLGREQTSANEEKHDMRQFVGGRGNSEVIRKIVQHIAQDSIRKGAREGRIDVVKSVTRAVPLGLNEQYFGFNGPSQADLARWSRATQHAFFHNPFKDEKVNAASVQAGNEMRKWIRDSLMPERRRELANGRPANDVVSLILKMSETHRQAGLSDERMVANIIGLLVGSVETTSAAIAQSLQFLMNNPAILARAKEVAKSGDNALMSRIVWEALRFDPVNPWLARYVEEDYVLGRGTSYETQIPKGSLVLAATESAMWDEEVFKNPGSFDLTRDPSKYMHLGYGYHRCLGDDVSLVMVPETVRQILLMPGLRKIGAESLIDQADGPFPESYPLAFEPAQAYGSGASFEESGTEDLLRHELLGIGTSLALKRERREILKTAHFARGRNPSLREKAVDELPELLTKALAGLSDQEKIDACMNSNPRSAEVFPNPLDRRNYCSVRLEFRSCYFVQRLIAGQSSFTSYYRCAYGKELLSDAERRDFKAKFANLDLFYFLNLEEGQ